MLGDVLALGSFQLLEPTRVAVDDVQAVADLGEAEFEVGDLPGELMPVQRRELRELFGENTRNVGRVRHGNPQRQSAGHHQNDAGYYREDEPRGHRDRQAWRWPIEPLDIGRTDI